LCSFIRKGELGIGRLRVEAPGLGKGVVDQRLRDTVVHHDEEADILQGPPELGRRGGGGARARGEIRTEIHHRNHDARG
jgi:hypothetical protein